MEITLFDTVRRKRLLGRFGIFLVAFLIIYDAVYVMDLAFSSNIFWKEYPLLLRIWTGVVEPLMGYVFYWISFSFVIYAMVRFGIRKCTPFFLLYLVGVVLRFVLNVASYLLYMGAMNWNTFAAVDLPGVLLSIFGDCLQLGAVVLLGYFFIERKRTNPSPSFQKGKKQAAWKAWFPFERLFDLKNPVLRTAFLAACIPSALMLLQRLYYDVFFYGLPTDGAEWTLVITYYLCDVLSALAGYLCICFLQSSHFLADEKAKLRFEHPLEN